MSASKTSTASHTKSLAGTTLMQPPEKANSSFPEGTTPSPRASTPSSTASTTGTPLRTNSPALRHPLSPLDREYTKPSHDIDIAQQLLKQSPYWSAKGWVQRSASLNTQPAKEDPEARTRKFEEAKREILASAGRFS
ncbi:hypothetical protein F5Y12DRAFT_225251 [Xylaria sp. FL1777]|nr:hypothetical protein F5Y12DRAFT_225251 [Xylaria sp. FL1777]